MRSTILLLQNILLASLASSSTIPLAIRQTGGSLPSYLQTIHTPVVNFDGNGCPQGGAPSSSSTQQIVIGGNTWIYQPAQGASADPGTFNSLFQSAINDATNNHACSDAIPQPYHGDPSIPLGLSVTAYGGALTYGSLRSGLAWLQAQQGGTGGCFQASISGPNGFNGGVTCC